jgi:hypothetical protein
MGEHEHAARSPRFQQNLEATVRYLQNAQLEDGGFAEPGSEPNSDFTAWVALALAAAGINPRDQTTAKQHYAAGHSAYSYLAEHAREASATLDLDRELLVVDATGASPQDFGGVDLVHEILGRQVSQGSEAGGFSDQAPATQAAINDTVFAILALSPIHEQPAQEAVQRAAVWLEREQDCDGSWHTVHPRELRPCDPEQRRLLAGEEPGEVDMTGAALQALNAAGRADPKGQEKAFAYLRKEAQTTNGGFPELPGGREPNVASTAWVAQAMWSAGIDPETWTTGSGLASEDPLSYLASMQQEDGHIRWEASQEWNGMWMTAYVTPALAGEELPIAAAPYEPLPLDPPGSAGSGNGGESPQPGGGVISGGGGDGAPLFSRPQPRSKGHTPGGARLLTAQHVKGSPTKQRRDPGPARGTSAPTSTITVAVAHAGRIGAGGSARRDQISLADARPDGGRRADGQEVRGVLIGAPARVDTPSAPAPGAPGLHGAGVGDPRTSWLAIAIAAAALALALVGAAVELRRPRVVL